ncbi:MAG: tetratricopeptide repeat protein, partial [Erysipelotrichales bacterium]|nr:tetratricopeptide repeat protein [Erysipelotrichales bacterium]
MKKYRIFVASSINEFHNERLELGAFVQKLNEDNITRGIYADLEVCEEFSNAVSFQGKQNDYNDLIRTCDFFYALFGKKTGKYTVEEYRTAHDQYRQTGKPEITVFTEEGYAFADAEEFKAELSADHAQIVYFGNTGMIKERLGKEIESLPAEPNAKMPAVITILAAISLAEKEGDQAELLDYVRSLNDTYIDYGLFFDLRFCENNQNAVFDELQRQIDSSSFFYVIIGDQSDPSVIESFEYAYNRFLKENKPRIYTYFQILPEGTDISEEVRLFMERLGKEISHYYSRFSNLDSIKLNMLLELTRTNHLKDTVDIKDGKALVNGKELMSLENIPVFKNNEEREKYKAEIRKLREEKTKLAVQFASDPDNMDVYKKLSETATRYAELQKTYHDTEKAILDLYSGIVERNSSGESVTWREKKASEYLDNGDYNAALAVLRDPEREEELQRAYEKAGQAEDEFVGYIKEGQLKIDTLKSQGVTSANLPEIYDEYEKCVKVAKEKLVKPEIVYGYAYFLRDQKDYRKAIENAEWYSRYRGFKGFDSKKEETGLENLLGLLYSETDQYKNAEVHYRKAIETTEELPDKDSDVYNNYLTARYNNLGNLLCNTSQFAEAEECLTKAIAIQNKLAGKNSSAYEASLALFYNNYGTLC